MGWSVNQQRRNEIDKLQNRLEVSITQLREQIEELELKAFLLRNGVPIAGDLARAISCCAPENRKLLAAIAVKESGGDVRALGAAGERGIYQVQARYWGKVPTTVIGQTKQADRILTHLKKQKGSEFRAVMAYNGSGRRARRYAEDIFRLKGENKWTM